MARRLLLPGLSFLFALCMWGFAAGVQAEIVYTFENLDDGQLVGQDGWLQYSTYGTGWTVQTGTGTDSTKVAWPATGTQVASRTNDTNFSFVAHNDSDQAAVMQFDLQYVDYGGNYSYYFGLGADSINDTDTVISSINERSPAFGIFQNQFAILDLASTVTYPFELAITSAHATNGDWIRLRHVIDFTANSGDGGGRLFYQNLTRGDTTFTELTTSAVNLRIKDMLDDVEAPSTWDSMVIVKGGEVGGQIDNLMPNSAVPEPSSLALLLMGLALPLLRWRRRMAD